MLLLIDTMSTADVAPAITYQILYKDVSNNDAIEPIKFADFSFNSTITDKKFKAGLKSLFETKDAKLFIGELLFVAEKNDVNDLSGSQFPFIFAIDTITGDNHKRTYLTFTGTNSADAKVNFNQYSVDVSFPVNNVSDFFNEKLITMEYSGYEALSNPPPPT